MKRKRSTFTFASMFSGGGGWDLGAIALGGTPRWSIELDPEVAAVYQS